MREADRILTGNDDDVNASKEMPDEKAEPEDPFADNPFNVQDDGIADGNAFNRDAPSVNGFFIFPAARAAMRAIGE